jgi:tetrapyrrole methylase family protein / MazG family protein
MTKPILAEDNIGRLREVVRTLRSKEGCPWDREQKKEDLGRYLIEEAYEVIEAIEKESSADLREELGDLLFQIVFLSRMAEEKGEFSLEDVIADSEIKMIRRHPHVFGKAKVESVADVKENWAVIKEKEGKPVSVCGKRFEGITKALPALLKAQKITQEAAKVGFDWEDREDVLKKVDEELRELKAAIKTGHPGRVEEEMGDMFLSLVNLCRFLNVDAETALRKTLNKFTARFSYIEEELQKIGKTPAEASLAEMDRLWEEAKLK